MRTAQPGDRVRIRYVKRFDDGSVASCRAPVEVTVGVSDPRLPGLGQALVGLAPGAGATVRVSSDVASAPTDPTRVRRWARSRFPQGQGLAVGKWIRASDRQGRTRFVRILKVNDETVLVDTNRRCAGQGLKIDVELVSIYDTALHGDSRPV